MQSENRVCQNCQQDFTIEPDDFSFYEKIKVPPPTWCPECRLQRRLSFRNERSLYKRSCDLCQKNIISMYALEAPFPVYCPACWKSDAWDPKAHALDYDFSRPFFEQFKELFNAVPRQSVWQFGDCINVEYTNFVQDGKNVYLGYSVIWNCEDVYFSSNVDVSKQIIDSLNISNSERIYESIGSTKNYNCRYLYWSSNCVDCSFLLDCINCSDCFGCVNLRNAKYCIWNEQYTKEEYETKIRSLHTSSYSSIKNLTKEFWQFALKFPRKYARVINSVSSTGDELRDSKNSYYVFNAYDIENVKYGYRAPHTKDSMDVSYSGIAELAYEHAFGGSDNSNSIMFIIAGGLGLNRVKYCDFCQSSTELFGCIGLRGSQYCILNKQYSKEEYHILIDKIIKQMTEVPYVDKAGREYKYGEFFPSELSPFGYDETVANEIYPLNKEEAEKNGFNWKDKKDTQYQITLKAGDLVDSIEEAEDSILEEIIECAESGKAFRITQYELQFYRQMGIPLPRLHPDIRYKNRIKLRNPLKLWHRSCMKEGCDNEFETSYAPDRPEIIYCERCYQQEVY